MINENLILKSPSAIRLYHDYAKDAPIYDYHCHLSAQDILDDAVFTDISELWLGHDHYKWRAMRQAGIEERLITGDAPPLDKFRAFARTVSRLVGCPLYHWVYLELKTYFDITETLDETSADRIYKACNKQMNARQLRPSDLIRQSRVQLIGTTDDPTDDLAAHFQLKEQAASGCLVVPTFRPDRAINIQKTDFTEYLDQLAQCAGKGPVRSYGDLLTVLRQRIDYFAKAGCLMSDHSLESLDLPESSREKADGALQARLTGKVISAADEALYRSQTLAELAMMYSEARWAMQLHIGALRNNNPAAFNALGADTGFDIMNDFPIAEQLAGWMGRLEQAGQLPATILYSLNGKDNLVLSTVPQCFADGQMPGKVQFGAAWWFIDSKDGIEQHLKTIATQGLLPTFIGMLTDSRSFLSYTRHDYFRRILCQFVGDQIDTGEFEASESIYREIIEGVCYRNIVQYLRLE